ncbi:MAG TPA: hypothetical protein VFR24_01890 [Candidatus Angelobacter sp.]|nr:hypothetical protein [Candidatus Angelobacter sp.]
MFTRIFVLVCVLAEVTLSAQQKPPYDLVRIKTVNQEFLTVERFGLEPISETNVSLKGLRIPDMSAAKEKLTGNSYFSDYDLRIMLLDEGFACLIDKTKADANERRAQDVAANNQKGIWQDTNFRVKCGYSQDPRKDMDLVDRLWATLRNFPGWMKRNWEKILGIVGTLASLIGIWTFWKRYDVVFAGARGVGKTVLIENLIDPKIFEAGKPESTRDMVTKLVRVKSATRITYRLTVADIGGQYPKWLFEKFARRRRFFLIPRKLILVLVLSPYAGPESGQPDLDFIGRQYGWVESLFKGFLMSRKYARRCKGVLVFVNMFDRYSKFLSDVDAQSRYLKLFQKHIDDLTGTNKNLRMMVGSGMRRWHCDEAWRWITRTVSGTINT